jgi:hypothetical protein
MSRAKQTYPTPPDGWWTERQRYEVVDLGYRTPCWRWLLSVNGGGYGQVAIRSGGRTLNCRAHRLYYERAHGPVDRAIAQAAYEARKRVGPTRAAGGGVLDAADDLLAAARRFEAVDAMHPADLLARGDATEQEIRAAVGGQR